MEKHDRFSELLNHAKTDAERASLILTNRDRVAQVIAADQQVMTYGKPR